MSAVRVLVIEDSFTIRAIVEAILAKYADIEIVDMVDDVEGARTALAERKPHVITLDLGLPGIDGWAFLDELRATSHAPVLVVSSATPDGSDAAAEALKRGADACFDKGRLVQETPRFIRALRRAARHRYTVATPPPEDAAA
jgi:chemotaxis response regulator CheB